MKNLKIESNQGYFLQGNSWVDIVKITKSDLMVLVKNALEDADFEVDAFEEAKLPNPAQKIVYKHVNQQLQDIHQRRDEFLEKQRSLFKDAFDKYCQDI